MRFVERRKEREINRMSKDNLYELLEGTDYVKNPDKLDDYRNTKNKMFGTHYSRVKSWANGEDRKKWAFILA